MSDSPMERAITIFDRHANDVLSFTGNFGGKDSKVYLLQEMLYSDDGLVDYQKLGQRLRKLPAVLTFWGTLKNNAEAALASAEEDFQLWYAQKAAAANEAEVARIMKQDGPASMKKPPTLEQIRGLVMVQHKTEWEAQQTTLKAAKERVAMLSRMVEGLKASIDLVRAEASLMGALLNQGLERTSSPIQKSGEGGYRDLD